MKYISVLSAALILTSASLSTSCGTRQTTPTEEADTTCYALATEEGPGFDETITLPAEASFGGNSYNISITRTASDSLPKVSDSYGDPYLDNVVRLTVKVNGNTTIERKLTKSEFAAAADGANITNLVFGGMVFDRADANGLHFNAALHAPDDDEICVNFNLTVNPNTGAMHAERDRSVDDLKSEITTD